jgi:hypothetical protein
LGREGKASFSKQGVAEFGNICDPFFISHYSAGSHGWRHFTLKGWACP